MNSPELSVVLVSKFGLDRLQRILAALAAQSIAGQLEVVIVSPFDEPSEGRSPFARVRYVKLSAIDSLGAPRAAGVQACSAPYLVFAEDHCFPRPGWGAALLKRLREGWTGVGPLILNHNPSTSVSRAEWLLNYACFSATSRSGPVDSIPPNNSAYRTAALQALGPELANLLQMDHHLQTRLISGGGRLFLESSAQAAHTNVSRLLTHWAAMFHGSRIYGATRADYHRWPVRRRYVLAAAFLPIAAIRLTRVCRLPTQERALLLLPLLMAGALLAAAGEASGYLFGTGSSLLARVNEELDRLSAVSDGDRHLLLPRPDISAASL